MIKSLGSGTKDTRDTELYLTTLYPVQDGVTASQAEVGINEMIVRQPPSVQSQEFLVWVKPGDSGGLEVLA